MANKLDTLRELNKDLYDELIKNYSQSELADFESNDGKFSDFSALFMKQLRENTPETGEIMLDALEANSQVEPLDPAAPLSPEDEEKISNPFLADPSNEPDPVLVGERADELLEHLEDEGSEFYQKKSSEAYKANNSAVDPDLDDLVEQAAVINLSMETGLPLTFENYNEARAEEKARIEQEYYNSLYAAALGDEAYSKLTPEEHLERYAKIEKAIGDGRTPAEIFQTLKISPTPEQQKIALTTTIRSNTSAIKVWMDKYRRYMKNGGKMMDKIQQLEAKHPALSLGAGVLAAGNPIYMGYRGIMASRAIYNDYKNLQDFAAFSQIYKGTIATEADKFKDGKFDRKAFDGIKQFTCKSYKDYLKEVKGKPVSREEFATLSYNQYVQSAGGADKAVSRTLFDSVSKYTSIAHALKYEDYVKEAEKTGRIPASEAEYAYIKDLKKSVKKATIWEMIKDSKSRQTLMGAGMLIGRSFPVAAQVYGVAMLAKKICQKSYRQNIVEKNKEAGRAIKDIWKSKGRDKDAWKRLYKNSGVILAETAGVALLAYGVSKTGGFISSAQAAPVTNLDLNGAPVSVVENQQPAQEIEEIEIEEATERPAEELMPQVDVNNLTDEQKHNIEMLFKRYPRGASLIMEGNDNPSAADRPEGRVISSAKLATMWENGEISDEQKATMLEFSAKTFDARGNFIGEDAAALNAELSGHRTRAPQSTVHETHQNPTEVTPTVQENAVEKPNLETSVISAEIVTETSYAIDKDGNIIYQFGDNRAIGSTSDMDRIDAAALRDLQERIARGEALSEGELKFVAAHSKGEQNAPITQEPTNQETVVQTAETHKEQTTEEREPVVQQQEFQAERGPNHKVNNEFLRGNYRVVGDENGNTSITYTHHRNLTTSVDRDLVDVLRETQTTDNSALGGIIQGESFSQTRLEIENVAKKLTMSRMAYDDLSVRIARGENSTGPIQDDIYYRPSANTSNTPGQVTELEARFMKNFEKDLETLAKAGVGISPEGRWVLINEGDTRLVLGITDQHAHDLASRQHQTASPEFREVKVEPVQETIPQQQEEKQPEQEEKQPENVVAAAPYLDGYDGICENDPHFKGSFDIKYATGAEGNTYTVKYDGSVRANPEIHNALRGDGGMMSYDDKTKQYVSADGSMRSSNYNTLVTRVSMEAQKLTVHEAIYKELQTADAETKDSQGVKLFMAEHEKRMDKLGFSRDEEGRLVPPAKENASTQSELSEDKGKSPTAIERMMKKISRGKS